MQLQYIDSPYPWKAQYLLPRQTLRCSLLREFSRCPSGWDTYLMPHLHYDRDPGRSPLQHSWETSPLQWCLGAHSQATGHTYIMEHLPYRLGRIFTPSHHECHQLRCVSAVMLCVGSGANRRDTPSFDPFEYPSPPVSVFSTVPSLRGKSFHAVATSKTLSIGLLVNTFVAFSGDCNQVMHALNGNYTWYPSFCPKPHSRHWSESFSFQMEWGSSDMSSSPRTRYGCMFSAEVAHLRSRLRGASLPHCTGSHGTRWPPREASREAAGISFKNMERCLAATNRHPTTTLTVRHTYLMMVCKTPDATTLTIPNTYLMKASCLRSQAVTNTAVLTGDAPFNLEGGAQQPPGSGGSTDGWTPGARPAGILEYGEALQRIPP